MESAGVAGAGYGLLLQPHDTGQSLLTDLKNRQIGFVVNDIKGTINPFSKNGNLAAPRQAFWTGVGLIATGRIIKHFFPSTHRMKLKLDRHTAVALT